MKQILATALTIFISGAALSQAQSANGPSSQESSENAKVLEGKVQELMDAQGDLRKQIQGLMREISDLREKAGKPTGNFATQDDLKRLADAIEKVDKRRIEDNEKVLAKLSELGKTLGSTGSGSGSGRHSETRTKPTVSEPPPPTGDKNSKEGDVFSYTIKSGDTFSSIAKAYRDQGVKVYTADIERANPGVDSSKLKVDQKIFIPAPKDKAK